MRTLKTDDGVPLHWRQWNKTGMGPARGTVLIVHGLGEHIGRYEHVAAHLNHWGWHVVGHDQRGHGASGGARGDLPHNGRFEQDLALVIDEVRADATLGAGRLVMLGHSMGGLIAASAIHHAELAQMPWQRQVSDLVCLGTPHQGAPLEKAGHGVDLLLKAAPFAAPLGRLAGLRSAGITDLRWGRVVSAPSEDERVEAVPQVPLPQATRCYALAGCLGSSVDSLKSRLWGDGLVPVASALGQHADAGRRLEFAADRTAVVCDTGHLDLLSSAEVYERLRAWLG